MEIKEMKAVETFDAMVARLFKKMPTPTDELLHAAVGVSGEAAELLDGMLRNDFKNIPEELGDLRFYVQAIFNIYGWNMAMFKEGFEPPTERSHLHTLLVQAGEVLDLVKKAWVYGKELNNDQFYLEVGKLVGAYCAIVVSHGYSDDDITYKNMYKLTLAPNARYPLGYSDAAAIARADKAVDAAAG